METPPETHRYRLLAQTPHGVYGGGREWRVDASRFPISKTITGVVLDLDPGALRELHWHPNADEKGNIAYIPQGYGHSIENVGDKQSRILIGLNAGTYELIDLSQ